jgi:outer membrane protein OmpA-like peptidoglycan-associated protein
MRSRFHRHSGRAAPAIIVVAALAASATLFFTYTNKRLEKNRLQAAPSPAQTQTQTPSAPAVTAKPQKTTAATPAPAPAPAPSAPKPPAPASTPAKPAFGFARPLDLGKDLAHSLNRQDWTRAAQLAAPGNAHPELAAQAKNVFEQIQALGYKAGPPAAVEVLGQVDRFTRLALPLTAPDGSTVRLQLDVERDETMGWKVAQFRLPPAHAQTLTALPIPPSPAAAPSPAPVPPSSAAPAASASTPSPSTSPAAPARTPAAKTEPAPTASPPSQPSAVASTKTPPLPLFVVEEKLDALGFADGFVRRLLSHDFGAARGFLDESRVPAERLAGLCIVFEEGQYEMLPGKPLVMTASDGDASWVIAQVKSEKLDQQTEFGIELQRQAEDQPWRVVGLNLSDILSSFAQSATKLGVPYTPIVKNPRGGESLALYFEYDEAGLHPRAQKQLQIVANLLKSDTKKRLRIAGHTDALGAEDYNLRLSRNRALSVKKELVALGVSASQIDTTGLGTAEPLGPNQKSDGSDDPEGRSKNRRAEIYLDF